ncbi:MAG: hypothetical protein ACLVFA_02555 [Butyricicoccus sp.]
MAVRFPASSTAGETACRPQSRREQHALVGVVHLGIPPGGSGDLLRFAG